MATLKLDVPPEQIKVVGDALIAAGLSGVAHFEAGTAAATFTLLGCNTASDLELALGLVNTALGYDPVLIRCSYDG